MLDIIIDNLDKSGLILNFVGTLLIAYAFNPVKVDVPELESPERDEFCPYFRKESNTKNIPKTRIASGMNVFKISNLSLGPKHHTNHRIR